MDYRKLSAAQVSPNYTYVFEFESAFDPDISKQWMVRNWHFAVYCTLLYLLVVYSGRTFMKNRPRYELRIPMFCWNLSLAVFSFIGASRTWPEFIHVIREFGLTYSVCSPSYMTVCKVSGFWSWMFALSKAPELLDTLFIVARKHKLIFLHLYHHITIFVFLWYGYSSEFSGVGRWYVNLNFFVHFWMYSYFAVRSLGIKVHRVISMAVTTLQIIQMLLAFCATMLAYETKRRGHYCFLSNHHMYLASFIVTSYALLFLKFFYDAYVVPGAKLRAQQIEDNAKRIALKKAM